MKDRIQAKGGQKSLEWETKAEEEIWGIGINMLKNTSFVSLCLVHSHFLLPNRKALVWTVPVNSHGDTDPRGGEGRGGGTVPVNSHGSTVLEGEGRWNQAAQEMHGSFRRLINPG